MKRILSLLLVFCMLTALVACGASKGDYVGGNDAQSPNNRSYAGINDEEANIAVEKNDDGSADQAGKLRENAFISTLEEPVSTFSADVDTAAYTYFRKMANSGYTLEDLQSMLASGLRTEEFVNYFDYNYNLPDDGEVFGTKVQIADCPWNPNSKLMILGIAATAATRNTEGNNLVFLIDVSGSMASDDKLPLLKRTFSTLVSGLSAKDCVSIVTYSGEEKVVLEACPGNQYDKIMKAINSLQASGSTNGQAGLRRAYEIARAAYIQGGNNRIIMASDGDLNVGISSPTELKAFVEQNRKNGLYLSVLGFGYGNYRDANMEALADNGNGAYYYIDSAREAERVFGDRLCSTMYTVAEDVKFQITFDPAYISSYRLIGYENRVLNKEDFNNDKKDAGEVGAGHTLTIAYELVLTAKDAQSDETGSSWMKLAMRYKTPGATKSTLREYTIGTEAMTETPDEDYRFISAVISFCMLMHNSKYAKTDLRADLQKTLQNMQTEDGYKREFIDLVTELLGK